MKIRINGQWRTLVPGDSGAPVVPVTPPTDPGATAPPVTASGLFSAAQTSPVPTVAGWGDIANAQISRKPDVTAMGGYAWAFSPITAAAWRVGTGAGASWAPMPIDAEASEITLTAKAVTGPPKQVGLIVDFFTSATTYQPPSDGVYRTATATLSGAAQDIVLKVSVPAGATHWKPNLYMSADQSPATTDVVTVKNFAAAVTATRVPVTPSPGTGTGEVGTGKYMVVGKDIVAPDGKSFLVKGFNVGGWNANGSPNPERHMDATMVDYWKTLGVNTIRYTMNPTSLKSYGWLGANRSWNGVSGLPGFVELCKSVVAFYRQRGMVTMLEFHDFTDGGQTETHYQQAEQAWALVAGAFKGQSDVWFNLANEPAVQGAAWTEFHRRMTKAVRDTGADNIIVVDGPVGGTDGSTSGKMRDLMKPVRDAFPGYYVLSQHNYNWGNDGKPLGDAANYRAWAKANHDAGWAYIHGEVGHRTPLSDPPRALNLQGVKTSIDVGAAEFNAGILWWAANFNDLFKIYMDNTDPYPGSSGKQMSEGGAAFMAFLAKSYPQKQIVTGGTGGGDGSTPTNPTPTPTPGGGGGTSSGGSGWSPAASTTGVQPGGWLAATSLTTADTLTANRIGTANRQDSGVRDPCMHPGLALAPVNIPLVDGCQTVDVPDIRHAKCVNHCNFERYGHSALFDPRTQAAVLVQDTDVYGHKEFDKPGQPVMARTWRMLPYRPAAGGTDGNLQVMNVMPDGTVHMIEAYQAKWVSASRVDSARVKEVDLSGMMTGPNNGIRAFDGPCVTGLIREHEVDKTHPLYKADPERPDAPLISHAIAISLDMVYQLGPGSSQNWNIIGTNGIVDPAQFPGWDGGTQNKFWFTNRPNQFRYPAASNDAFASDPTKYRGSIWMGDLFCIPSSVNIHNLNLGPRDFALARAAQDYGFYVEDANGGWTNPATGLSTGGVGFYVEYNGPRSMTGPASWFTQIDWGTAANQNQANGLNRVVSNLRRVVLNTQKNPGGGPLTAKRRRPFAAPIAGVDPARTMLDSTRQYLVTGS